MNIYDLERKYGKYALPNLSLVMIGIYVLGFILQAVAGDALFYLTLDPHRIIFEGQVWRIISWIVMPPYDFGIFTIINLYFIYVLGRMLERIWGNFRYNLYVLSGILFVIVGAFVIYGIACFTPLFSVMGWSSEVVSRAIGWYVSTYYIMLSVILAFSMTVPDMQVRLYFFIPLKMKWLAYLDMALLLLQFISTNLVDKCVMIISLLNFFIFYLSGKKKGSTSRRYNTNPFESVLKNKSASGRGAAGGFKVYEGNGGGGRDNIAHRCVICGITEKDAPKMIFRYCSKCNGSFEYCEDHLYTHKHVE